MTHGIILERKKITGPGLELTLEDEGMEAFAVEELLYGKTVRKNGALMREDAKKLYDSITSHFHAMQKLKPHKHDMKMM